MIRITTVYGTVEEYDIGIYLGEFIYITQKKEMHLMVFSLSNFFKIEKQVKDLTLEECDKLGATFTNQNEMETYYFEYNGRTYMNTDYIDITSIVKGE